jgi:hypothetical protein
VGYGGMAQGVADNFLFIEASGFHHPPERLFD